MSVRWRTAIVTVALLTALLGVLPVVLAATVPGWPPPWFAAYGQVTDAGLIARTVTALLVLAWAWWNVDRLGALPGTALGRAAMASGLALIALFAPAVLSVVIEGPLVRLFNLP